MRKLAIATLMLFVVTLPAAANMVETVDDMWNDGTGQYVPGPVYQGGRDVLYDNGPFETEPGLSVLQSVTLGMNTLGFGHQFASDIHIADDFEVTAGPNWEISSVTFFAYQTNSPTSPSPITGVYFQIWAWLFVLSAASYAVDYFQLQGMLRWSLILIFMMLKAGLIVAVFMHMMWERLSLIYAIVVPPVLVLVFVVLMVYEANYVFWMRDIFFIFGS